MQREGRVGLGEEPTISLDGKSSEGVVSRAKKNWAAREGMAFVASQEILRLSESLSLDTHLSTAIHSISTRPPSANPLVPNALRAGKFLEKYPT